MRNLLGIILPFRNEFNTINNKGSHTFVEFDYEIISVANLFPSTDSRRVVVSNK